MNKPTSVSTQRRLARIALLVAIVGVAWGPAVPAADDPAVPSSVAQRVQRAKELMQARRADAAFALLSEVEYHGAGDPEFDYALGIAALDAAKPDKATLAFDRVLAVNPLHAGALVDRGRAHAALGNDADARADFEAALKLNPAEATRAQLQSFLAQLERRAQSGAPKLKGYLGVTLGHDSNVNFAASERDVFVPLLADTIQLAATSTRQSDAFLTLSGGASFNYPLNPQFAWFASVDGYTKRNQDVNDFHLSSLDARFGPSWSGAATQTRLSLNLGTMQLGDDDYRKHTGFGAELRFALDASKQWLLAAQHTRFRYQDRDTRLFDTDQSVGLVGLSILANEEKQLVVSPFLLYGRDNAVADNPQGDKLFKGVGLLGRIELTPARSVSWSLSAQRGSYQETDPFFFAKRRDKRFDVSLGFSQRWGRAWLVRPQIGWTRQDSNIAPYDFKRVEASITLRREFE